MVLQQFSAHTEKQSTLTFLSVDCVEIRESRRSDEIMPPGSHGEKNSEFCVVALPLAKKNVGYTDVDAEKQT